jgi:predicted MFS family arabinose efflux permease
MTLQQKSAINRWALAALFAVNGFIMGAWAPQIPLILPRHTISETMLGLLILCLGLGAVGAMLFSGRLIAAYGSARVASVFSVAATPTLALVVLSQNLGFLALSMTVMGAMLGSMDVAMNANAVQVERRLGRAIMSSSHGFWSLGGFVGGAGGAYMIAHIGPERQALIVAGVALILILAALPFLHQDPPAPRAENIGQRPALIARDGGLWILGIMALMSMIPEGAVLDWAAIYLSKELGAGVFASGLGFAFFAGAMAIMRFAGDGLRGRYGAVKTLRVSALVAASGLALGGVSPTAGMAILGFAIAGLGVANLVPILFSAAGNRAGLPPGIGISTVTMVGYSGILVAPSAIGFVGEHIGFRITYLGIVLMLLALAAMAARAAAADDLQAPAQSD